MVPENTIKFANFMVEVGRIKVKPASWKDYFSPEAHNLNGI
jgi:NitT/TauT family transport system substrate-binding protein